MMSNNKKNTISSLNLYELINFIRDNCNLDFLPNQILAIFYIASRNGHNEDFVVNQEMIAKDLKLKVRQTRKLLEPLIDKKIIIVSKNGRENNYFISKNYKECLNNNEHTGTLEPASKYRHRHSSTGNSGTGVPVSQEDTLYIKINNKINNTQRDHVNLQDSMRESSNENNFVITREVADDELPIIKIIENDYQKYDTIALPNFVSDEFQEFLSLYPNREINRSKAIKQWLQNDCQSIASHIIDNLKLRISSDSYFVRNISADTTQFIPQVHTFLRDRIWESPINEITKQKKEITYAKDSRRRIKDSDTDILTPSERYAEISRDRRKALGIARESDPDVEILLN